MNELNYILLRLPVYKSDCCCEAALIYFLPQLLELRKHRKASRWGAFYSEIQTKEAVQVLRQKMLIHLAIHFFVELLFVVLA